MNTAADKLLAACRFLERAVGVRFGSRFVRHPGVVQDAGAEVDESELIEMLADDSGLRARRVLLDGAWWRDAGDPMLARLDDRDRATGDARDRHWVALVPSIASGYRLRTAEPLAGIRDGAVVDEAIAHRLSPFGFTFYLRFPERPMSAIEVFRFGLRGNGGDIGLLVLAAFNAALLGLLIPVISGKLIDVVIPAADAGRVWQLIGGLFVAGIAVLLFDAMRTVAVLRLEARGGVGMQAAILDRVISLPATFFRKYSSGDLSLRMAAVNAIQQVATGSSMGALLTSLFLAGNLALMFWYSPRLSVAVIGILALALAASGAIAVLSLRFARELEELHGKLRSLAFEYLAGIAKIRTSASEARVFANWRERYLRFRALHVKSENLSNLEAVALNLLYPAVLILVLALASGMMLQDARPDRQFTTGDFIAFNAAMFSLLGAVQMLLSVAMSLVRLKPVWERARPIVETMPERLSTRDQADTGVRHEPRGGIDIRGVCFRYPDGPEILTDVTLSVEAGAFVAVVGPSGSGKSTLFRLLLGFERPDSGSVRYDGRDLAGLDLRYLRRRIGTVLQGGRLWSGDLYANIAGAGTVPIERAWEAARVASLAQDIEAMPMGMYTVVGEGSSTLSGGQRQRVLIARAVVHRPKILLLDEATSALDNDSQSAVQAGLAGLDATRVVIAHRLNTVRHADLVVVLDRGRIVQRGSFEELAAAPGTFAELLRRQIK
jgi:ATP-binding cassette subfamily C protein